MSMGKGGKKGGKGSGIGISRRARSRPAWVGVGILDPPAPVPSLLLEESFRDGMDHTGFRYVGMHVSMASGCA
jgi:hypothetical protein